MWRFFIGWVTMLTTFGQNVESQYNNGYERRFFEQSRPYVSYSYYPNTPIRAPISTRVFSSAVDIPSKKADNVRVDVYYETNCPDSMRFITYQLYPMYRDLKDIVDIHLVPFGNAAETYNTISKKYQFICQHGPAECYGNTVQSCAISLYPAMEDHFEFINCMESYPRPSDSGQKCARRVSMDWNKISKCADGDEGNRLLHEKALETTSLNPPLNFVPWTTINKVNSDEIQRQSMQNLKQVICATYKGNHSKC